METLYIASDHAGVDLKSALMRLIPDGGGIRWKDLGPGPGTKVDYPDHAQLVCEEVMAEAGRRGVLICGSGIGMSIAANKFPGIRAALCADVVSARLAREHNDANVLCLASRFWAPEYAAEILRSWLETPFSGDPRHVKRLNKISDLEK